MEAECWKTLWVNKGFLTKKNKTKQRSVHMEGMQVCAVTNSSAEMHQICVFGVLEEMSRYGKASGPVDVCFWVCALRRHVKSLAKHKRRISEAGVTVKWKPVTSLPGTLVKWQSGGRLCERCCFVFHAVSTLTPFCATKAQNPRFCRYCDV